MTLPPRSFAPRNRANRLRSPAHRKFVASHLCIAYHFGVCAGRVDCCHARDVAPREQRHGGKPDDTFTVSMCRKHHQESEKRELDWGRENGLDVLAMCLEFAGNSPDKAIRDAAKALRPAQVSHAESARVT